MDDPSKEGGTDGQPLIQQLKRLLDGLTDAAVIVDKKLRPLAWNTAYIHVVGVRPRLFAAQAQKQDSQWVIRFPALREISTRSTSWVRTYRKVVFMK